MEFHGKVICVLPARVGQSTRTGEQWMSQDFVLEADGQYIRRGKFSLWGADRIKAANLQLGEYVTAKFELEAHEYNGQWFNDTRCYDIEANGISRIRGYQRQQQQQSAPMQQQPYAQGQPSNQAPAPTQYPAANPQQGFYMTQEQIMQQQLQNPDPFVRR